MLCSNIRCLLRIRLARKRRLKHKKKVQERITHAKMLVIEIADSKECKLYYIQLVNEIDM